MPAPLGLSIGALAELTGTNAPTVRFYEQIGLLRRPQRRAGGHRTYGPDDVRRLTFIRRCREFGFPIEQTRTLVALTDDSDRSCLDVRDLAHAHLASLRAKLAELKALEKNVAAFAKQCDTVCFGVPGTECIVLKDLSCPREAGAVPPQHSHKPAARTA